MLNGQSVYILNSQEMPQKQQKTTLQEQSLRYRLLPLVTTSVQINLLPLNVIQIALQFIPYLQVLRYSIDYLTPNWLAQTTPIFSYTDLSYYLTYASPAVQQLVFALAVVFINLYWIVPLSLFLSRREHSNWGMNLQRFLFILTKNVLFLPLLNIVISLFLPAGDPFHAGYSGANFAMQFAAVFSFSLFTLFLAAQSFFNFQFLNNSKCYTRVKKSAFTCTFLLGFMITSEVVFTFLSNRSALAVFAICSLLMLVLFIIKKEHLNERYKLIELSFLCVNLLGIGMAGFTVLISYNLSLQLFFLMAVLVIATVMKYKSYSIKFQLQNINKWPTADIILRYTNNLRYYLQRKDEYLFRVYIHGYMEIHRHKCDYEGCASRAPLSDYERKLFEEGVMKKEDQQIYRFQNVIKKIYEDGYKLTPINPELELENCIYLYEHGEKDKALKNLLLIKFQDLSFEKYYKFTLLKRMIHREMSEVQDLKFIDLVSEIIIKHQQEQIIAKLDKAAIKNLEFWSILNEDHPDFQKLNEVGAARIQIREEVRETYRRICQIAYSEKVTSLYVQYLQAIENDEAMFNCILESVKQSFKLQDKIVLQDWANTSQAIMVVSIEQNNMGTIIDINSSCALLFGYEKYQAVNHSITMLFGQLGQDIQLFLRQGGQEDVFAMTHKSGYMVKVRRSSQNYNSMDTGMASIISLTPVTAELVCSFFFGKQNNRILGMTSSAIALTGIQLKFFEQEVLLNEFFIVDIQNLTASPQGKNKLWNLAGLISELPQLQNTQNRNFRVGFTKLANCNAVDLKLIRSKRTKTRVKSIKTGEPNFQFQVQANLTSFKYFGCHNNLESFISQFSQLSYAESLKQANTIPRAYDEGISTLRLKNNIIQVIEENAEEEVNSMKKKSSYELSQFETMPRKDQEEIFSNRTAFEGFIYKYSFARSVNLILLATVFGLVALYLFFYVTFAAHASSANTLAQQITYRNLIIGAITKKLSLVYTIQQMQKGQSQDHVLRLVQSYNDNLAFLNSIKFNGGDSYSISIELGNDNVTFQSNEYLLSFINYAQILSNAITPAKNRSQLLASLGTTQLTAMNYILQNAPTSKEIMIGNAYQQQGSTLNKISQYQNIEAMMLAGGILFLAIIALVMLLAIQKINKERINIFEIFLDITEMQIQQFSSKTERFLTILHVEDANGEIDVEEEVENTRKINSSTFAKKKKFKHINFNKSIYLRLLIIPLFGAGFLLHAFVTNYQNLEFHSNSSHYFFLTSEGDYKFYSGMADIQSAYINNATVPTAYSENYILYYKDYFDLHYYTFGYVDDFHQAFTSTFMTDTCTGVNTTYGSTQVAESCLLPLLYPNGSYLVFTDIAMKTAYLNTSYTSLNSDYIIGTEVLSKTHRKMSDFLIQAQNAFTQQILSSLLTALIAWILVMNVVGFVYGVPIMKKFVDEINEIKNILSILPISLARELPLATAYFNKVIHGRCCD